MDDRPPPHAPMRQRFAVLTQDKPAEVTYTQDKVWYVDLHDGSDPVKVTEGMLSAVVDPRHRLAIDEILGHERGKAQPHPLIHDLDHG